jgi:ABC-type Mn2+/Zn2+ transport system ATPase subunit
LAERVLYLKQEGLLNVVAATPMQDLAIRQNRYLHSDTSQLLGDREDALQQTGLFQFRDTPTWELSGGQVKRIAFAALPLFPFHYWILDEPFLGLDTEWSSRLHQWLLERKAQGRGAFIVTHQTQQMEGLCHHHYHIQNGKISRMKHV